ncbi:MAG: aspartate kinase, partial [Acidimicrobiales bacterium]
MALLVQKFGGTSVADAGRLRAVAGHVAATVAAGNHVVVVVSAMGRSTDDLLALAQEVSVTPLARELDVVATAGERISMALLCMALADLGQPARSFTGQAAGILTDSNFGRAAIVDIDPKAVLAALEAGEVAVVAGFQGASAEGELTALGRGGSDTTAVALAAALGADSCEIYTDVTGVFTADPRVVPRARRLDSVSYEEMLEMAATGGKVLALRSVEFARNHGVEVHVRSSFTWEPGTWVANPASNASSALTMNACPRGSESEASLARPQDEASPFARVEDENAASGGSG